MVKGPSTVASRIINDGSIKKWPGMSGLSGDQPALAINSGLVNLFGGASGNLINFLVPFDYKAVSAYCINTVNPGSGPATIGIGTTAVTDGILDDENIATNEATTFQDLTSSTSFTAAALFGVGSQGDIIVFQTDGGGTSTGKAIWGVTIVPR